VFKAAKNNWFVFVARLYPKMDFKGKKLQGENSFQIWFSDFQKLKEKLDYFFCVFPQSCHLQINFKNYAIFSHYARTRKESNLKADLISEECLSLQLKQSQTISLIFNGGKIKTKLY
jgi:hypothetical protein